MRTFLTAGRAAISWVPGESARFLPLDGLGAEEAAGEGLVFLAALPERLDLVERRMPITKKSNGLNMLKRKVRGLTGRRGFGLRRRRRLECRLLQLVSLFDLVSRLLTWVPRYGRGSLALLGKTDPRYLRHRFWSGLGLGFRSFGRLERARNGLLRKKSQYMRKDGKGKECVP